MRDERRAASVTGDSIKLRWRLLALAVILLVAAVPRLAGLDRLVTPDEPIWLARSANFNQALHSGNLEFTYQYAHPGVTVMWLGAIAYQIVAPDYSDRVNQQVSQRQNKIAPVLEAAGYEPLDLMVAGRIAIVIAGLIALALAYWTSLRLLGFWEVTLGFLLLALDPFGIALTRLLHVDGLTSLFLLLSVVAALAFLADGRRWPDLVLSAIAGSLAILTRVQSSVVVLFLILLFLIVAFDENDWQWPGWQGTWTKTVQPGLVWSAWATAIALLLWPALSVDPGTVAREMFKVIETAAVEGHERSVYFVGFVYEGDPGWRYYPLSALWRATPTFLVGLGCAAVALLLHKRWRISPQHLRIILGLIGFATVYMVLMTLAAKKFDRYLLPAIAPMMIVAGWGIIAVSRRISNRLPGGRWATLSAISALALLPPLAGIANTNPYYLPYYNPLLGGAEAAADDLMIGWGEGFDQVAEFLNEQPNGEQLFLATEAWPSTINYFFDGSTIFGSFLDDRPGVFRWASADYYALYITHEQRRNVVPRYLATLEGTEPALVVNLNSLDYIHLYDISQQPIPAYMETGRSGFVDLVGVGRLIAGGKPGSEAIPRGSVWHEELYFDSLSEDVINGDRQLGLRLQLVDANGAVVDESDGPLLLAAPERHGLWTTNRRLQLPFDAPGGNYQVTMTVYDLTTGAHIHAFGDYVGMELPTAAPIHYFYVAASAAEQEQLEEQLDAGETEPSSESE